jgi:hypothetical protein
MASDFAFSFSGEPIDVPSHAAGWRVRRIKPKGAPEVVYAREGTPLTLPLDADLGDLRCAATLSGKYRLDPVDDEQRPIPGAAAGYVYLADEPPSSETLRNVGAPPSGEHGVIIEAMRMNAQLAGSIVDRMPSIMEAAAGLLRAADGAGLPAREGRARSEDDADEADDEVTAAPATGWNAVIEAVAPMVFPLLVQAVASGKIKIPRSISAALEGAAPRANPASDASSAAPTAPRGTLPIRSPTPRSAMQPATSVSTSVEARAMAAPDQGEVGHFLAIQAALSPEEASMARALAAELSAAELRAWLVDLTALSVADGARKIRDIVTASPSSDANQSAGGAP